MHSLTYCFLLLAVDVMQPDLSSSGHSDFLAMMDSNLEPSPYKDFFPEAAFLRVCRHNY